MGAYHLEKGWAEQLDMAKSYVDKEDKRMKKFTDGKRRQTDYKEGDIVLVILNLRQNKTQSGVHQNLVHNYDGPFNIISKVGKIS